jgi:hypothetical protein
VNVLWIPKKGVCVKQRPVDENGKRIILVQIDPKYLLDSDRDKYYRQKELEKRENLMDYISMVKALKEGKKATRPSWEPHMYVWFDLDMILHTHPYWPDQQKVWDKNAFPYICEKDDATCNDWLVVDA